VTELSRRKSKKEKNNKVFDPFSFSPNVLNVQRITVCGSPAAGIKCNKFDNLNLTTKNALNARFLPKSLRSSETAG
jgi:hypothetical protein